MNRILKLLGLMILMGCSSEAETFKTSGLEISLSDEVELYELNDEFELLGSINTVEFISEDKMVIADNSPAIYLFENHVMTAAFGKNGKGPCEFEAISAIELENEKLHVLDQSQTKIISYDINTQECVGEINNKKLSGARFFHKEVNSPSFIIGITSYSSHTPDSAVLIHRIYEDESSKEIDFQFSRINSVNARLNIMPPALDFKHLNNNLYAYFPLTDSLYIFTLPHLTVTAFPLNIDIIRRELENAGNDANKLLGIIRGDFESVNNIFVHHDWLAVELSKNIGENGSLKHFIRFYDHDGNFLSEYPLENRIRAQRNNKFVEIVENPDPSSDFAFAIAYRSVATK